MRYQKGSGKMIGKALGLLAVLGAATVAAVLCRINTENFEKKLVEQTHEHLRTIARTESQHAQRAIMSVSKALTVLAENPKVKEALISGRTDEAGPIVEGYFPEKLVYQHLMKKASSLYRLDGKGCIQMRIPRKEGKAGSDYSLKPGVRAVLANGRPHVSALFKNSSGIHCVSVCVPVLEEEQVIGVLRSVIRMNVIHACLKDSDIGSRGYAWMISEDGIVMSYPDTNYVGTHLEETLRAEYPASDWSELHNVTERMARGEEGIGFYCSVSRRNDRLEDVKKITAFTPVRVLDQVWSLGTVVDYEDISRPVQAHARNITIGMVVCLSVVLAGGIWLYVVQKDKDKLRAEAESARMLRFSNNALNQEIAERKQAEEKLRQSEKELRRSEIKSRAALENSPVCTKIVDLDFNLQYMSRAGIESLGIDDITEYYGRPYPFDFYPESFRTPMTQNLKRAKETGEIISQEASVVDTEGNELWFHSTVVPVNDDQGQLEYIVVVSNETTERKRAEVSLKSAADAAQAANIAKSQFLANMSHEIRTPMNAIMGFSEMLSHDDLTEAQKANISLIRESAASLLNLINDILDFSKIEAGQLDIEKTECSLGKLLSTLESIMKMQAFEKPIDFQIKTDREVPAHIHTDPHRLQQCLINLTSNAFKFTEQGHVHVKVSAQEIEGQCHVRFDVEDTGIGIADNRQAAIFEAFTQADNSTTRKYGGTGLGLAVTKQLVELLDGELALSSEPGKGSVFSLIVPSGADVLGPRLMDQDPAPKYDADEPEDTDRATFRGKVLVAEDVEGNQRLMTIMLSKLGIDVVIAEDGNQAVEKASSEPFDLILMDIQMPNMNGYEATRLLKQRGIETPIVALTANAMKGDDQQCLEAGCDGYLSKPIGHKDLKKVLLTWLSRQATAAQT